MGTTSNGLRYPELSDPPNAPQSVQFLAADVDARLYRAYQCTSTTRPTGLGTADRGFLADEADTGNLIRWSGTTWSVIGPAAGGGGGGGGTGVFVGVAGQWSEATAQSIPFNTNTVVRFPTTNLASGIVTRATQGPGHKFTVAETGTYAIDTTVRFAAGDAGGNRYLALHAADDTIRYAATGNDGGPGAVTLQLSVVRRLAANAALTVIAAQTQAGGAALLTQPVSGGAPTGGWQQISITKIAG